MARVDRAHLHAFDRHRVLLERSGRGEPVLLIMGTGADHSLWAPTVSAYEPYHSVIVFDQRGTGRSSTPADEAEYTSEILADDAAALLDAAGVERAHVAGLSLGSAVAQQLAIRHPPMVASLQLHCTWGRTDAWLGRVFESMAVPLRNGDRAAFVRQAFMWVMSPEYLEDRATEVEALERAYLFDNPFPPSVEAPRSSARGYDAQQRRAAPGDRRPDADHER